MADATDNEVGLCRSLAKINFQRWHKMAVVHCQIHIQFSFTCELVRSQKAGLCLKHSLVGIRVPCLDACMAVLLQALAAKAQTGTATASARNEIRINKIGGGLPQPVGAPADGRSVRSASSK